MPSLTKSEEAGSRIKHGVGPSSSSKRPTAAQTRDMFMQPPAVDAPVKAPPAIFIPDHPSFFDEERFGDINKLLHTVKAKKLAKAGLTRNALGAAFMAGWELGDYLFPQGYYSVVGGLSLVQDLTTGGWEIPGWTVYQSCADVNPGVPLCPMQSNATGFSCINDNNVCRAVASLCTTVQTRATPPHATPWEANQHTPSLTYGVYGETITPAGRHARIGRIVRTSGSPSASNPDNWVMKLVPGTGTPIVPLETYPSEEPEAYPLTKPMDLPTPQTYEDAVPREPVHQPSKIGSRPAHGILPVAMMPPVFTVRPSAPGEPPITIPPQVIVVTPDGPPSGGVQPPPETTGAQPRPPGRKKEKKLHVRNVAGGAWVALNIVTEGFDFVEALFDALPKELRPKPAKGRFLTPYDKAKALFDAWDQLPSDYWQKALAALINNQVEDAFYGLQGQLSQKALKFTGQPTGSGGISARSSKLIGKAKDEKGEKLPPPEYPLPTVEYVDGNFVLTYGGKNYF